MIRPIKAVLFDLDGTLVDTAPDMALALNLQLKTQGLAPLPLQQIRPHVSNGVIALLKLGFAMDKQHPLFEQYRQQYLDIYRDNLYVESRLFNGFEEVLEYLDNKKIAWGVVTNKPAFLAEPLLKKMGLFDRCCSVISGDTVKPSKPNPKPLFVACQQSSIVPTQVIYVGDAKRDISAAKSAGMLAVAAEYGYIPADDDVQNWGADLTISKPLQLQSLIARYMK